MADDAAPTLRIGRYVVTYSSIALATLVLCTSSLVLAMRYSRSRPIDMCTDPPCGRYITSTAVVMSEVVKVTASMILLYRERAADPGSAGSFLGRLTVDLLDNWKDTATLGVPGCASARQPSSRSPQLSRAAGSFSSPELVPYHNLILTERWLVSHRPLPLSE